VPTHGSKGGNSLDTVTPGLTLGTLYSSGVGTNKTKQHTYPTLPASWKLTSLVTGHFSGILALRL
jgi:hypothetical protein